MGERKSGSAAKRVKINGSEEDASARAHAVGDKAMEDASRTLLGGMVIWAESSVNSERNHHALSANAFYRRPQTERFLRSTGADRFQTVGLAEHQMTTIGPTI